MNRGNCRGDTPLFVAAQRSHLEVVRCLLDAGADDTLPNKEGQVPIFFWSGGHGRTPPSMRYPGFNGISWEFHWKLMGFRGNLWWWMGISPTKVGIDILEDLDHPTRSFLWPTLVIGFVPDSGGYPIDKWVITVITPLTHQLLSGIILPVGDRWEGEQAEKVGTGSYNLVH